MILKEKNLERVFAGTQWQNTKERKSTLFLGHRGASGFRVENTLSALQTAMDMGADGVEFDVMLSQDDVPIVFHDLDMHRLTSRSRKFRDLKAQDICSTALINKFNEDVVYPPLLETVLSELPKETLMYIEVKDDESNPLLWKKVWESVLKNDCAQRSAFCSFNVKMALEFKKHHPELMVGGIFEKDPYLKTSNIDEYQMLDVISVHLPELKPSLIAACKINQQVSMVWTVNKVEDIETCLDMGADAIVSDKVFSSQLSK